MADDEARIDCWRWSRRMRRDRRTLPLRFCRHVAAIVVLLAGATHAHAAFNLIPGTEKTFSATLGATIRPYAAPGERLEIRLRSRDASPGFLAAGTDRVVTLVFKPLSGTDRRVVVLAADCGG